MARIYISSTFADLKEFREAAYRILRRMGHEVILMEDSAASDQRPLEYCMAKLSAADLYIGIFAYQYGYIPPGETQSISELEYREAMRQGIPSFLFLLSEDASWPEKFFDKDDSRIKAFRQNVLKTHSVTYFKNREDLEAGVSRVVSNLQIGRAVSNSIIVTGERNVVVGKDGVAVGRDVTISAETQTRVISEMQAYERIGAADHVNLDQLQKNISQARSDSSQLFKLTLIFSSLGFLTVAIGVFLLLFGQVEAGVVSSVAGIIPEAVAVLFFRKDKELRATIEGYHQHMINSQHILTMVDISETVIDDSERDRIKREIIYRTLNIGTDEINQKIKRD